MRFFDWRLDVLIASLLCVVGMGCDNVAKKASLTAPASAPSADVPATVKPPAPSEAAASEPEITLEEVSPERYQQIVAKQLGKVVVVDFWATWCGPCVKQFPHTVELSKKYADRGLVAISMSFDELDQKEKAIEFLKSSHATITNLISLLDGPSPEQMEAYQISEGSIPHFKVYDRQGKLRKTFSSANQEMEGLIEELLSEPAQ